MNRRLQELERRRQFLIAECGRQRDEVAFICSRIKLPFDLGGLAFGLVRIIKTHPIAAAGVSTLVAGGYAGTAVKLAGKGVTLWRLARPVLQLLRKAS